MPRCGAQPRPAAWASGQAQPHEICQAAGRPVRVARHSRSRPAGVLAGPVGRVCVRRLRQSGGQRGVCAKRVAVALLARDLERARGAAGSAVVDVQLCRADGVHRHEPLAAETGQCAAASVQRLADLAAVGAGAGLAGAAGAAPLAGGRAHAGDAGHCRLGAGADSAHGGAVCDSARGGPGLGVCAAGAAGVLARAHAADRRQTRGDGVDLGQPGHRHGGGRAGEGNRGDAAGLRLRAGMGGAAGGACDAKPPLPGPPHKWRGGKQPSSTQWGRLGGGQRTVARSQPAGYGVRGAAAGSRRTRPGLVAAWRAERLGLRRAPVHLERALAHRRAGAGGLSALDRAAFARCAFALSR